MPRPVGQRACSPLPALAVTDHSATRCRHRCVHKPTARRGLSPLRSDCRFPAASAGSSFPACLFRRGAAMRDTLVCFRPSLPFDGEFVSQKSCQPRTRHSERPRALLLPLGRPLLPPDRRSPRLAVRKLASARHLLPLPPRENGLRPLTRILGWGSPHLAWLADSMNLLEPQSSCTGRCGFVNAKRALFRRFSIF